MSPNSFRGTTEFTRAPCPSWGGQWATVPVHLGSHMHQLRSRSLHYQRCRRVWTYSRCAGTRCMRERWDSKGQISTAAILAQLYDCQTNRGRGAYGMSLDVHIFSFWTNFPRFHSSHRVHLFFRVQVVQQSGWCLRLWKIRICFHPTP